MEQIAFKMLLNPDQAEVYKKRHDEIWDELVVLLKDAGISDYSIFLERLGCDLAAVALSDAEDPRSGASSPP